MILSSSTNVILLTFICAFTGTLQKQDLLNHVH